jgi:hypothetical protein
MASLYERQRRAWVDKCGSYYCERNHWHGDQSLPYFFLVVWPGLVAVAIIFYTLKALSFMDPAKGADAIESVEKKVVEVKKAAAERKKMHTLVEGKGEND